MSADEAAVCLEHAMSHPIEASVDPATARSARPTVLILGRGAFSGLRSSLVRTFRAQGWKVLDEQFTLRRLRLRPLLALLIMLDALARYGRQHGRHRKHTRAACLAYSLAADAVVRGHPDARVVLMLQVDARSWWRHRRPGVAYFLFTDHVNLLSKQLPHRGIKMPERDVSATWNRIERSILSAQDHIFVMGSQVKRCMVDDYGIAADAITVVGAGPNLALDIEADATRKNYAARNVLFVGIDAERKGLPVLRKAFARVRQVFPDALLHVVGVDGAGDDGVVFYGRLTGEALKRRFYEAQIFALPAFREPFGVVLVEAMWAKNVCIGTHTGAMSELILEGETGHLVEPGDDEALAARIIELFNDPQRLQRMAERGYAQARERWNWEAVARPMLARFMGVADSE